MSDSAWSLLYYGTLAVGLSAAILGLSYALGQKHREPATDTAFESGIVSFGTARVRVSVNYYLIALVFVIFDVEAVFLFAWAVAAKELGWSGYYGASAFIGILIVALIYEWRMGALDWSIRRESGDS